MADPLRAKSISCGYCPHGTITVYFHDEAGEVFALASMDVQVAADFLEQYTGACEAVVQAAAAGQLQPAPAVH